jgi:uncharacterized phosphosugar-binding protein
MTARTDGFAAAAAATLDHLAGSQREAVEAAAAIVVRCYRAGGVLQVYGTGHSRAVTLELAGRAGGLVPVNMLAIKDLVMFGGADPASILDPAAERRPGLAEQVYRLAAPAAADAFLIVSHSGINPAVVEMARLAREYGHPLIAVTSLAHTAAVATRDPSGQRLADLADVVVDTGAPAGDAAVDLGAGVRVGALSSLAGVIVAQLLTERVCHLMLAAGDTPPVYLSANLPQGDTHNAALLARYAGRIRPIEP